MPCSSNQACLYVTDLSERLKYLSIVAYYQAVIFYHVCAGYHPVRASDPILCSTLKGIERSKSNSQKGKDPILPAQLKRLVRVIDVSDELEVLVWVAALLMFRTLLRVSHVVLSPHTLKVKDVVFTKDCCVLLIHSSKTKGKGAPDEIPVVKSGDKNICAYRWLKHL